MTSQGSVPRTKSRSSSVVCRIGVRRNTHHKSTLTQDNTKHELHLSTVSFYMCVLRKGLWHRALDSTFPSVRWPLALFSSSFSLQFHGKPCWDRSQCYRCKCVCAKGAVQEEKSRVTRKVQTTTGDHHPQVNGTLKTWTHTKHYDHSEVKCNRHSVNNQHRG